MTMRTLPFFFYFLLPLLLLPDKIRAECDCGGEQHAAKRSHAVPLKLGAIFSILTAGFVGVSIPIAGKHLPALRPEARIFFAVKAFAAGVILATGFVHILPDAFDSLTSPCLSPSPWQDFPFAGFVAMVAAIGTLVVDTVATGYYSRVSESKARHVAVEDEEAAAESRGGGDVDVVAIHSHATHGHEHGPAGTAATVDGGDQLLRHRLISQVLELGIVVHSVIIGISLGASDTPSTIRPLLAALSFHQFFEGMGLGACLVQAQFNLRSMITMMLLFCLTTPVGIAIGIGISSLYNENSPTALIVDGILNSGAAGILIYMALVDLLAADFMNPKVQKNINLQIVICISLLIGTGLMSLLAKWA